MTAAWDPDRYLTYADQRGRPFVELIARIGADDPARVVDLGCGPGNLTALLAARWPRARVIGVDSSAEMIERARADHPGIGFEVGDVRGWASDAPNGSVDVLVSNAALQWVPGHLDVLPDLVSRVRPGGWFAFQVPGNFDEPSHTIRRALESEPPYAEYSAGLDRPASHDPPVYLDALARLGCRVDAWETTYLHVLDGTDPVFTWVSATSARPVLNAFPADLRERFVAEFKRRLAVAYPDTGHGVVLPFRRVFVVAHIPGTRP